MKHPVIHLPASAGREEELVDGLRRGEVSSYRHLYELFAPRLRRMLGRVYGSGAVADDAVQATFLIAFQKVGQFDGRASLLTWLTRIALRQAGRASRRSHDPGLQAPQTEEASEASSPEEVAMRGQLAVRLAGLIAKLPERKRVSLLLFEVEGLSVQEVADVLDEPRGTVLARLSRTRAELREALAGVGALGVAAPDVASGGRS